MADFARLAREVGDVPGVKAFLFATPEGAPADCMNVADPEQLASSLTLMVMHAAPAGEALGSRGLRCLRVGAKNREDTLVFRLGGGGLLGVIKEAGASGSGIMAVVAKTVGGRDKGKGEGGE